MYFKHWCRTNVFQALVYDIFNQQDWLLFDNNHLKVSLFAKENIKYNTWYFNILCYLGLLFVFVFVLVFVIVFVFWLVMS